MYIYYKTQCVRKTVLENVQLLQTTMRAYQNNRMFFVVFFLQKHWHLYKAYESYLQASDESGRRRTSDGERQHRR